MANRVGSNYFRDEKHLTSFLEENIELFCDSWLYSDLFDYEREHSFSRKVFAGGNKPRIDFWIKTIDGKTHGLECKKLNNKFHESTRSISQLLSYGVLSEKHGNPLSDLMLITNDFEQTTSDIIKKYKLPIRYLVITRDTTYEIQ